MTRKVKPCVTIPYWKILQDREGEKPEEEREGARQAPQQETLLEAIGQATGGRRPDARRAEPQKPEAREEEQPGGHDQPDAEDALISETFEGAGRPGPAWTGHSSEGWWWHQASGLLYSESDRKYFVWEELLQQHVEADPFHAPAEEAGLSFRAEAASAGSGGAAPGRSVVIRDLIAAGQALRTPLQHLDRPAALFALFQGGPGAEGQAEFRAKGLHAKLLRALSRYRGPWSGERVRAAFRSSLESLDREFHAKHAEKACAQGRSCVAVLLLGPRIFAAALGDCEAMLFRSRGEGENVEGIALTEIAAGAGGASASAGAAAAARAGAPGALGCAGPAKASAGEGPGRPPSTAGADSTQGGGDHQAFGDFRFAACQLLARQSPLLSVVLCAGADRHAPVRGGGVGAGRAAGLLEDRAFRALLMQRRPRVVAGALASRLSSVRHGEQAGGGAGAGGGGSSSSSSARPVMALAIDVRAPADGEEGRPPKRQRVAEAAGSARIRCRHILLKHREVRQPMDSVRRRRVGRSREEAEALLRELLPALLADTASFPQLARKHSECTTCLRGGEQAGDLGWLVRGNRGAGGVSKEVEDAAFSLAVGELSDIVVSDAGVHLVQRIA